MAPNIQFTVQQYHPFVVGVLSTFGVNRVEMGPSVHTSYAHNVHITWPYIDSDIANIGTGHFSVRHLDCHYDVVSMAFFLPDARVLKMDLPNSVLRCWSIAISMTIFIFDPYCRGLVDYRGPKPAYAIRG